MRVQQGVCVLTREQDTWGAAYMSFILAKQTGLDIEFAYADPPLLDAPLYLMPRPCPVIRLCRYGGTQICSVGWKMVRCCTFRWTPRC